MVLAPVHKCITMHGLSIDDYIAHLVEDGMANGLEVWLVGVAVNTPVNIVQEDTVWSSARSGLDFSFHTLVLTSFGMGYPACWRIRKKCLMLLHE